MQQYDGTTFKFSQLFSLSINGKSSATAFTAFISVMVGLAMFILITIMVLFTKDSDFLPSLITLAAMATGLVTGGLAVLAGGRVNDSSEIKADINKDSPPPAQITNIKDGQNIITPTNEK